MAGDISTAVGSGDALPYRLVGLARDGETQIDETSNSRYYVSPSLTWHPDERTTWTLLGQYQRDRGGSTYQCLPATARSMRARAVASTGRISGRAGPEPV